MDAIIAQNLSPRVEAAIRKILGDDVGPFDGASFSAHDYINQQFPDEASLSKLDGAIADLDDEIKALDGSILETVREQSTAGSTAAKDVAEAKDSIGELHSKIAEIKKKAEDSEAMVQEICRDIRKLDVAKRNLTSTINVITRLRTLTHAVEELKVQAANKEYQEAAMSFEAAISLFGHFGDYRDVPKVSELTNAVEKIREELRESVTEDFDILLDVATPQSLAYETEPASGDRGMRALRLDDAGNDLDGGSGGAAGGYDGSSINGPRPLSEDNIATLRAACEVVDALGPKERKTLLKSFVRKQLKPYQNIFRRGEGPLGDSLEAVSRRVNWARRALKDLDRHYSRVMPPHWRVLYRFILEFCEQTRNDLDRILSSFDSPSSIPPIPFVQALSIVTTFENDMAARFEKDMGGAGVGDSGSAAAAAAASSIEGSFAAGDSEAFDDNAPLYNAKGDLVDPNTAEGVRLKYARRKEWEKIKQEEKNRLASRDAKLAWLASLAGTEGGAGGGAAAARSSSKDEDVLSLPRILEYVQSNNGASQAGGVGGGVGGGKRGLISAAFEPFMSSYIRFERSKIEEKVTQALQEEFGPHGSSLGICGLQGIPALPVNSTSPVVMGKAGISLSGSGLQGNILPSSSVLFAECRNALSRSMKLSMPTVMLSLIKEIKETCNWYCLNLQSRLPTPQSPPPANGFPGDSFDLGIPSSSSSSTSSSSSAASGGGGGGAPHNDPLVIGPALTERISLLISTADYCAETLPALAENIKKMVAAMQQQAQQQLQAQQQQQQQQQATSKAPGATAAASTSSSDSSAGGAASASDLLSADIDAAADGFMTLQAVALKTLAGICAALLDRCLRSLHMTHWEKLSEVGDSSPYLTDVARILRATMPLARQRLNEAAFRNYCDKFAKAFIPRYQAAIFKCNKIGEVGAQQMLLDAQGLKSLLLAAPTMRVLHGAANAASGSDAAGGGNKDGGGGGAGIAEDDDDIRAAIAGTSSSTLRGAGAGGGGGATAALNEDGTPIVAPAIYIKTVTREMPRIEMLFKIIAAPMERFAHTIRSLWPEVTPFELTRTMELKALSKKEQAEVMFQMGFGPNPANTATSTAAAALKSNVNLASAAAAALTQTFVLGGGGGGGGDKGGSGGVSASSFFTGKKANAAADGDGANTGGNPFTRGAANSSSAAGGSGADDGGGANSSKQMIAATNKMMANVGKLFGGTTKDKEKQGAGGGGNPFK